MHDKETDMKRKNLMKVLLFAAAGILLAACGGNNQTGGTPTESKTAEKTDIKIGGTTISKVSYDAIKPVYEAMGYQTTFTTFDSNPISLEAVNSGETDISIGQHLKFVKSFNESKNGDLDMAKPYPYYTGIGLYSEKHKSVAEIPDNGQIAVMNDAMNMDISLKILQDEGLIKLKDGAKQYTLLDIVENPKNLKIIDVDQAQAVTALTDMDASCIFFTHMSNAKKDVNSYLARDKDMINYPIGVIVKKENQEAKFAVDFAKAFQDPSVKEAVDKAFPGVFTFYESDDQVKE